MVNVSHIIKDKQYSTVVKTNKNTVQYKQDLEFITKLTDVIPNDGYYPFYLAELNRLGKKRFMELVAKARIGSDTPARLFCWMLKNESLVK